MEGLREYGVHEAEGRLLQIRERVATGEEVVITKAGTPIAKVVPLHPGVRRTGRGSLVGAIHIPDDSDELPGDVADVFGMG
ncbi:type II toxin-antitoxin system prevent-host-death family antitoxin [Streptomyces sp. NPDC006670]|uniref:type II toxin-antitoxin system Phd/YefM family antitoxin n=1 Tax=Streptomyces sp. NPDC006670 TaxID=3154476 RepID=UPI0033D28D8C